MEEQEIKRLKEQYEETIASAVSLGSQLIDKIITESKKVECVEVPINIQALPYDERKALYNNNFGLGFLGESIDNKLILISLICSYVLAMRKKKPEFTVLDGIKWLTEYEVNGSYGEEKYFENLAVICESFIYGVKTGNTFGLKSGNDLKEKVKEILSNRVPF